MDTSVPALNAVRNNVNAIRTTISHHIERDLVYNPNPNCFQVASRQLADLSDDVDPVLQFFSFRPVKPTANSAHIPIFLSTRPLAEMDASEKELIAEGSNSGMTEDEETLEEYNRSIQLIDDDFEAASQQLLSSILIFGGKS